MYYDQRTEERREMRIENEFTVAVPPERAWAELLDVEDLVGCLPGGSLRSDGEDVYRGGMSVALNGSRLECSGTLRPIDADDDERRASFRIQGREASGPAIGHGTILGEVTSANGSTRVALSAELDVTGHTAEPAAIETGARELLGEFARQLEERVVKRSDGPPPSRAQGPRAAPEPKPDRDETPAPGPELAPAMRRYGPVLGALALLIALVAALAGRRRRGFSVELRYRR
jgi:carbon monoxide dehydrogenase subunit G